MKKMMFLRDERGGILIMGSFALLLIGMGLLALSIDMPMTLNKESDAQMLLRKATAQASMEMQYTMYRCEAKKVVNDERAKLGKELVDVSPRPNNLWSDCPVEGGGGAFIEDGNGHLKVKGFMESFISQSAGKTRTQDTGYCIGGVSVRQNSKGEYYLYAYLDYPEEGMFTNTTGGATCECGTGVGGANLSERCNRVESGKLLTMSGELPYTIKLMFSVEASNKTATTASDKDALNSVGNTLDNIGKIMDNLGIGG